MCACVFFLILRANHKNSSYIRFFISVRTIKGQRRRSPDIVLSFKGSLTLYSAWPGRLRRHPVISTDIQLHPVLSVFSTPAPCHAPPVASKVFWPRATYQSDWVSLTIRSLALEICDLVEKLARLCRCQIRSKRRICDGLKIKKL